MLSSDVLEVVIGLVFAWFLLSLVVSALNEGVNWALRIKAKHLWQVLSSLGGLGASGISLRAAVTPRSDDDPRPETGSSPGENSPFVDRLYARIRRSVPETAWRYKTAISYVPARVFSDAVLNLAEETVTRDSLLRAADNLGLTTARTAIEASPHEHRALKDDQVRSVIGNNSDLLFEAKQLLTIGDVEALVGGNPPLRTAVRRLGALDEDKQVAELRDALEKWFNAEMEALSRYYRRQNRKIVAVLGGLLVFVVQADSLRIVSNLWNDADLRTAVSAGATAVVGDDLPLKDLDLPKVCAGVSAATTSPATSSSTSSTTTTAPVATTTTPEDAIAEAKLRLNCAAGIIRSARRYEFVELSWIGTEIRAESDGTKFEAIDPLRWAGHRLPGRAITFVALLFGASFWYDALKRLVGLRQKLPGSSGA